MKTAEEGQVKKIVTWTCCFLVAEDASAEKKKKHMSDSAKKKPSYKPINDMVSEAGQRRGQLDPRKHKL